MPAAECMVGARRLSWARGFPYLLPVAVAGPVGLLWGRAVHYAGDSPGYLSFAAERTATYPLFLDAVIAIFGTVDAVANIQLVLNAAALAFLGLGVRRAFDAPLAALIVVAFLGGWPHLAWWHAAVLTESLFVSCTCVLIGSLALLLRRPAWWAAALVSLACGLAITLRPAGVALAPLLAVALWLTWRQCAGRRWAVAAASVLPAMLCIWAESALWRAYHDEPSRPNVTNRVLFAKAVVIPPARTVADAELALVIAHGRELMAPGRELVESAPSLQAKIYLLRQLEQALHSKDSALQDAVAGVSLPVADVRGQPEFELLGEAALGVLMAQPASWLGNALLHWWGQWSSYWLFSPVAERDVRDYADSLATHPLFAAAKLLPSSPSATPPSWVPVPRAIWDQAFKWLLFAVLAASFAAVGLALWQRSRRGVADRELALAALCGLAMHGYFLLCGLFSVAAARFGFSMLPMGAVCGMLLVRWAFRRIASCYGRS